MDVWILWALISLNPGLTYADIRKLLGVRRQWIVSRLTKMEREFDLQVCEDDEDGLYPYACNGQPTQWWISMGA